MTTRNRGFDEEGFCKMMGNGATKDMILDFIDAAVKKGKLELLERAYDMLDRDNYDCLKREVEGK